VGIPIISRWYIVMIAINDYTKSVLPCATRVPHFKKNEVILNDDNAKSAHLWALCEDKER